jgi:NAD(P)-dependent dehydrogenase (short-subunit alcohol dehydrogenase family)
MSSSIFDLTGKVAIVTGGGSGIGRRLSEGLVQFGASVVVADINLSGSIHTVDLIAGQGGHGKAIEVDVTRTEDAKRMVEETTGEFGDLDILINCAGINIPKPALEFPEEDWDQVLDTNLKGSFLCCQTVGKIMISQRRGKIINIASQMGLVGFPDRAPYCASKGGVIQLTRALAVEWASYNVNVNAIAPTLTITPMAESGLKGGFGDPVFRGEFVRTIPLGRAGHPDDLVGAAVFLSSKASDFVTGHILVVDGGRSAR